MEGKYITFNLIRDEWIPIQRKDGTKEIIAPWQLTRGLESENPITELASPRPDFNGALIQFLIGLVQTAMPPKNERAWKNVLINPPSPEILKKAFENVAHAFDLDGDGARFMQDYELKVENFKKKDENSIEMLLLESQGRDLFIKSGTVKSICRPCLAMALFTLQTNAPQGGRGHRTSLRGGGPLTTIVRGEYLWHTIWLNIIESEEFDNEKHGNAMKTNDADIFPWMAPACTSENGREVYLSNVNPARVFWAVPRRLVVDYSQNEKDCVCDICGCSMRNPVSSYFTKSYGEAYGALWRHPLTPYYNNKERQFPCHVGEGGITYRHWPGFVFNNSEMGENALTINKFHERRLKLSYIDSFFKHEPRIWFFGYDIHNNILTRCWYEGQMPLITVEEDFKESYEQTIIQLVKISEYVVSNIKSCIKLAIFDPNHNVNGSFSFIESRFWKETESKFYDFLYELYKLVLNGENKAEMKLNWLKYLSTTALKLFDEYSQSDFIGIVNPERITRARKNLLIYNSKNSKKVRDILDLPIENLKK
ncbi:type I-E CRISPR-associated protein Cse1/CasA [Methanosarcina sp. WWM596]|uniref:type I-E CRISPR-associated protein Cse1/CasA n=1 Tax=Methanosarcina sp. WWM596 TaxID=1434103 RepID=UPI000615E3E6|nr:type I-E CRISPR-associated protein Cse1/CasA [Methanosarcina sp. WWM596]AKB19752.1 CRISPR-associated protein, Cse1 family [Methanosarcina sp. WWM596]